MSLYRRRSVDLHPIGFRQSLTILFSCPIIICISTICVTLRNKALSSNVYNNPKAKTGGPIPALVSVACLLIIFQKIIEAVLFSGASSYIDEAAIIFLTSLAFYVQLSRNIIKRNFVILILFGTYLFIISVLFGVNRSYFSLFAQTFLYLQFFLILISLGVIFESYSRVFMRTLFIAIGLSFIGCFLEITAPGLFSELTGHNEYNAGSNPLHIKRLEGFQMNPNALGIFFSFFAVLLMHKSDAVNNRFLSINLMVFALAIVIASGSRSAMFYFIVGFIFSPFSLVAKCQISLVLGSLVLFSGVLGAAYEKTVVDIGNVQSTTDTKYIRWLMTYHGALLAIDNFPIGTGAGTFGTALSHGSPVYGEVGLASLASVQEGWGIHDSNFGAISGEFGIIGIALFFGFNYYLITYFLKTSKNRINARRVRLFFITVLVVAAVSPFCDRFFLVVITAFLLLF